MTPRLRESASSALPALFIFLIFVTPFSISAIEITFPFLLLAWAVAFRWPWDPKSRALLSRPEKGTLFALSVYVALCTGSLATSGFFYTTARGLIGKLYEYALLFVIALFASRRPGLVPRLVRAMLLAAWAVVLHSLFQAWIIVRAPVSTIRDPITGHMLDYLRMIGPYKNPNDLAAYLMVMGLLLLSLSLRGGRRLLPNRLLLLLGVLGCLVWTQSMGALLGLLVGIGILTFFNRSRRKTLALLATAAAAVTAVFLSLGRHHLPEILTLSDVASKDRALMWNTAWAMLRAEPLWGVGYNTFMANYGRFVADGTSWPAYAHNCYLQIAAENGLLGLLAFLGFLAGLLWTCARAIGRMGRRGPPAGDPDRAAFLTGLFAGLCGFLLQSAVDTNLYALRQAVLFWALSGLALGLSGSFLKDRWPDRSPAGS